MSTRQPAAAAPRALARVRRSERLAWSVMAAVAAAAVRLAILVTYDERAPGRDSREYLALGDQLVHGGGFPRDGFRTPGYPAFVALMQLLPGRREDAIIAFQHLVGVLLVVAILNVAWHFFGKGPALLAAGLAALTPNLPTIENWVLADFLFGAAIFAAVSVLALAFDRDGSVRLLVAAGLLIALAAYVKPAAQFLLVAVPAGALLATRAWRPSLKATAIVALSFAVGVAPWVARTAIHTGDVALSTQGGATLFNRLFEFDRRPIPETGEPGRMLRRMQLELDRTGGFCPQSCIVAREDEDGQPRRISRFHFAAVEELMARGSSRGEALAIQQELAVEAIKQAPASYAGQTLERTAVVAVDATRFLQHGLEGGSRSYADRLDALGLPGPLALAGRAWLGALQVVSWAWLALGALGALPLLLRGRGRERIGFAVFAAAWLCMAGLIAATHGGLWRYSMSVAPLTWIVGAAGAGFLVGRVRAGWRDRRSIVPRS